MLEKKTWEFINSFAPWLSAIGTLLAVVTSLYLARRSDRIVLKVQFGLRQIIQFGQTHAIVRSQSVLGQNGGEEYVWLHIVNVGRRRAVVNKFVFRFNPFRKPGIVWVAPVNPASSVFPISLDDGEDANYYGEHKYWTSWSPEADRKLVNSQEMLRFGHNDMSNISCSR